MQAFTATGNFLYGSVDGSILSGAESGLCMIIGSLPPLRKPFDRFLKMILPDHLMERAPEKPSFDAEVFSTEGSEATTMDSAIFYEEGEGSARTAHAMVETGRGTSSPAREGTWG